MSLSVFESKSIDHDTELVVAEDADDAKRIWGEVVLGDDRVEWVQVPADRTIDIFCDDAQCVVTKTAQEWAEENGWGYLASENY